MSTSSSILTRCPAWRAGAFERRLDAARHREMVVLDQHRVVEAEAVIGAAAKTHRLLFQGAQAGRGLAGADDLGLGAFDRVGQAPGSRWRRRTSGTKD